MTSLKQSVELIEVDPEAEENPVDDEHINVDSESLSARIDRLGSRPTEQPKDGMKSLLQDIASELDLSERTDSPVYDNLRCIAPGNLTQGVPLQMHSLLTGASLTSMPFPLSAQSPDVYKKLSRTKPKEF